VILDSSAVIKLGRGDRAVRGALRKALAEGANVLVPSVVLAGTIRGKGPRDAPVNRVLHDVDAVLPIDERCGRTAGALLGHAASDATIDAVIVAATILAGGGLIFSSDARDLRRLASGRDDVRIHPI
jgi:predicted nucleic acid-binding protein